MRRCWSLTFGLLFFLSLFLFIGVAIANEKVIPMPCTFKANVKVDGATLTGVNADYTIKFKNTSGTEFTPVDTAGNSFGSPISGRFQYLIPKYDASDQKGGAQTGQKGCIEVYYKGTQLSVTYPAQGSCPAKSGEVIVQGDGEAIGFGGLNGLPNDAEHTFATPLTAVTPPPEDVANVSLGGDVVPPGGFAGAIDFGNVNVGNTSAAKTIIITNSGTYNLIIGSITWGGSSAQFKKTGDTCSSQTVAPNGTCNVVGTFNPTATGAQSATLTFATNKGKTGTGKDNPTDTSTVVTYNGFGIQEGFSVVPNSLDFGTLILPDTATKSLPTVVTNTGTTSLTFSAPTISGAQFDVSPNTAFSLVSGASQNLTVTYTAASSATPHTGTLVVTSGSMTTTVPLKGQTYTRPATPTITPITSPTPLTPKFTGSAFSSPDGSGVTQSGSRWVVTDASSTTVYMTSTIDASGNIVAGWDPSNLTAFTLPSGILQYGNSYMASVAYKDNRSVSSAYATPVSFATLAQPAGYDNFGVPFSAVPKDTSGNTIPTINTANMNSPLYSVIPQMGTVKPILTAGGLKDASGNTLATIGPTPLGFTPIKSQGGTGSTLMMAAGNATTAHTINSILPISTLGKTVDASGNLTVTAIPNPAIPSSINMLYGLFSINITVTGASTNVVIVPPTPFAKATKWYKIDPSTGKLTVDALGNTISYPNFTVDASGNGILTLTDNGPGDTDPRVGFVRDPGGPGVAAGAVVTDDSGSSNNWCFIATAAYGSYLNPFVKVLRDFRDTFLVTNRIGQSFVNWYYRTSPPIADFIAKSEFAKASVRIMLLPAVGFGALSLKIGIFWSMVLLLAALAITVTALRRVYRLTRTA